MTFIREINRLLFGFLIASFVIFVAAFYWAVVGADSILQRGDNPRLIEAEASILRGTIMDRNGRILAQTTRDEDDFVRRIYPEPASYSVIGYNSLRYGSGGAEAAYDVILRGDDHPDGITQVFAEEILHRPRIGSDIILSLDMDVQQALVDALHGQTGAAVLLSVPDGAILGLVSQPTIDPNTLDEDWDQLITDTGNPFYNRVLQGQYQPGGMLQTPLMTAAVLTQQPFNVVTADADQPIQIGDVEMGCAVNPPEADLTYTQAYAYGCPRPFSLLASQLSAATLQNIFDAFRLDTPPMLAGYAAEIPPTTTPLITSTPDVVTDALGQGMLTINPLGMAALAGSIINEGNAPYPFLLQTIIRPDGERLASPNNGQSTPLMTASTARRMRELMIQNTQMGAALSAARQGEIIGGHAALAVSGDSQQAWFIGFVLLEDNRGAAIALVLEKSDDAQVASSIGGVALQAAADALRQAAP